MALSIPQAASAIGVLWLDAPAAFAAEDGPHILRMYRFDFTGAEPPVEPPAAESGPGTAHGGSAWEYRKEEHYLPEKSKTTKRVDKSGAIFQHDDENAIAVVLAALM